MNVIRIPTKFSRSIKRLSINERLQVFDFLLKIGDDEIITLPDNGVGDIINLIYGEWMNMESRNWTKPTFNHISEWPGTNSPSDSAPRIEYNRIEYNRIKESIYDFWNSKKIIEHSVFTDDMKKNIDRVLAKYSEDDLKKAITNYADIFHDPDCFFKFKWTLSEFITRKNWFSVFIDKRPEDYKTRSGKSKQLEEYQKPGARDNFEFFTPEQEAKYGGIVNQ